MTTTMAWTQSWAVRSDVEVRQGPRLLLCKPYCLQPSESSRFRSAWEKNLFVYIICKYVLRRALDICTSCANMQQRIPHMWTHCVFMCIFLHILCTCVHLFSLLRDVGRVGVVAEVWSIILSTLWKVFPCPVSHISFNIQHSLQWTWKHTYCMR